MKSLDADGSGTISKAELLCGYRHKVVSEQLKETAAPLPPAPSAPLCHWGVMPVAPERPRMEERSEPPEAYAPKLPATHRGKSPVANSASSEAAQKPP